MGSIQAQEMAGLMDQRQAIAWNLQSNHYPPIPLSMVDPCIDAIAAVNDGDTDRLIDLPGEIKWRGESKAPALAIVTAHHLHAWIDTDEE